MALAFKSRKDWSATSTSSTGGNYVSDAQSIATGDLLVVLILNQVATNISSVTDTIGNSYSHAGSEQHNGGNYYNIYYCPSSSGTNASNQVTVHLTSNSTYRQVVVYAITGADTSTPLNTTANGFTASGTSISTTSITLSASSEIICAIGAMGAGSTVTGGSGYTATQFGETSGDSVKYFTDEYHIVSASEAASYSQSGAAVAMGIFAASFKVAASAGITYPQLERFGHRGAFRGMLH